MTKDDATAIAAHCQAQVMSNEFDARLKAAYEVIGHTPEYRDMAALLLHRAGINFRSESLNDRVTILSGNLAGLVLSAIACGFAFGEDFGETKYISKGIPA